MQYTYNDTKKASDMMWDAGLGGGGPWVHCSCGKDHSQTDEEFEDLGGFGYIELDGRLFVYECDGCAKNLARYENFIWANRDHIRRYLKIRIDQEKAWAEQEHLKNILAGIES